MSTRVRMVCCVLVFAALGGGCSQRQAYESVRQNARRECYKMTDPERRECLEQTDQDYDTYQRKRNAPP